jgi:hypothetical protein
MPEPFGPFFLKSAGYESYVRRLAESLMCPLISVMEICRKNPKFSLSLSIFAMRSVRHEQLHEMCSEKS